MQWLCHHDAAATGGRDLSSVETDPSPALRTLMDHETSEGTFRYAEALCQRYLAASDAIDKLIGDALANWELNRLSSVDRNVMRVATVELLDRKIPDKVILNEAIEIAREYGSADSPRFVNGVLDAVLKEAVSRQPSAISSNEADDGTTNETN